MTEADSARVEADDVEIVGNIEAALQGYVTDNMEGAVDQAAFLAGVDIPVAIVGASGTGKMYVAKLIHKESGGDPGDLLALDCKELRGRARAAEKIQQVLLHSEGKTLVFKAPQLLPAQVQIRLAKQLATRIQIDAKPARYLPRARYIALFSDPLESLVARGELNEMLASVFAGYPILIPPMHMRKRAVLRWAEKILAQEVQHREVCVKGFTPEAEKAMLGHHWRGNITEIRERVIHALSTGGGEWVRSADLGLTVAAQGDPSRTHVDAGYLASIAQTAEVDSYHPTLEEDFSSALGELTIQLLQDEPQPVGQWLVDEILLASEQRYSGDVRLIARFLQENTRNIRRWLVRAHERNLELDTEARWLDCRRMLRERVSESGALPYPLLQHTHQVLLGILLSLQDAHGVGRCALMLGVSKPTYTKKVSEHQLTLEDNKSRG
ncbi:MAG: sigma 54-interacting transcriptional regulator [Halioglobus sp.]